MTAMVLSSTKTFIKISSKLEDFGVKNIHFYNSINNDELNTPMVALVPFVDVVILAKTPIILLL